MDVKELKVFIAVVEAGSFSAASRMLHVTQPALSWTVKQLEDKLGMQLLERTNHGVSLTTNGYVLYEGSKDILEHFSRLEKLMQSETELYCRQIRFGLTSFLSMAYMELFESFKRKYQQYDLHFVQRGSKEIQNMILKGDVDMALISEPMYFSKRNVTTKQLPGYFYELGAVVSSRNPLYNCKRVSLMDIRNMPFSMLSKDYAFSNEVPKRCNDLGYNPNIVFQNEHWEVVVKHVASYDSVAILPMIFANVMKRNDVKWIPLDDEVVGRFDLHLVTNLDLASREEHILYRRFKGAFLAHEKKT